MRCSRLTRTRHNKSSGHFDGARASFFPLPCMTTLQGRRRGTHVSTLIEGAPLLTHREQSTTWTPTTYHSPHSNKHRRGADQYRELLLLNK
ncbi:hypothetical protein PUNSTDRAFT_118901 [Punctularia strigosozonata HHB-11173 SS5]|uniref:uncharacterized protein n=1 Tax=Punctularia strigosozonata (strain HHB-11173) TaxID=741275 RepID=UPI0004416B37|nr:uncharacterized protein PUNSTDRAFT_118901 [Punctularia strigosozonata HHB-11173 SS5]EIN11557.1 hypothetical protein PUNSTDRAFT_118901 [Punctularia strigosozonata HHB-11173 SS5]